MGVYVGDDGETKQTQTSNKKTRHEAQKSIKQTTKRTNATSKEETKKRSDSGS
jgi:hypothetical protein